MAISLLLSPLASQRRSHSHRADAELVHRCVHDLADYKKNVWMTVAVLCVGLSTSSFFLFLLPTSVSPVRKCYILLIGLIDLVSFGCLPALFFARVAIIRRVQSELGQALEQAHRLNSAEALMNEIKCTIHPREKLPFCSELILRALISNDLVKFLLVLCALTLAYLAVAYLIYWCVKHWVPHSSTASFSSSSPLCHPSGTGSCKLCPCFAPQLIVDSSSDRRKKRNMIKGGGAIAYSPLGGGGAGSRRSSASASSTASVPKFFAYSPALPRAPAPPPAAATAAAALSLTLVMPNNAFAMPSEQCSPVASSTASTASSTVLDEPIPSEPVPTAHGQNNNNNNQ
uniref:G_PROTEIN_RECEP_F1_2 domain-containing protein n=1 Tax=Globodera pallida TaxID=36090 RepID=A0A183CBW2_GLOPA